MRNCLNSLIFLSTFWGKDHYDVLGKEVDILVNEKQKPGNYKVIWDGVNQPSGVYFYKLKVSASTGLSADKAGLPTGKAGSATGDFIETKKMIFLK